MSSVYIAVLAGLAFPTAAKAATINYGLKMGLQTGKQSVTTE